MIAPKTQKPTPREEREAYELVVHRDLGVCRRCHRCGPVQRDHRKNRSQGGLTVASNLQCLGLSCHDWKTGNPAEAVAEGWAVPGFADPAEWPARRYVRSSVGTLSPVWVLYGDDGSVLEISDGEARRRMEGSAS